MTKSELIDAIAEKSDLSKSDAGEALDAFVDVVMETVAGGEKVSIPGFMTIDRGHRAARTGRNLRTGEDIQIPATNTVKLKAGSKFKEAVK